MQRNKSNTGSKIEGPMQAAFAKANVVVVKDTSLGANKPGEDRRFGMDPNTEFRRRQEDLLQDQMEFARQQAELEKGLSQQSIEETAMQTSPETKTKRVHRVPSPTTTATSPKAMVSTRRRIWEIMKEATKAGLVKSATQIGNLMANEGYKFTTAVVEFNSMVRTGKYLEVPKGYETAKPAVYLLKKDAPEVPVSKPYIPKTVVHSKGKAPATVPQEAVEKQIPVSKAAKTPTTVEIPVLAHTSTVPSTVPQEQVDPKGALKEALAGVLNLDSEEISDILLDSLSVKQTMVLYHNIKLLIGM